VLDLASLEQLQATLGGSFANLVLLIESFLEEAPKLLEELHQSQSAKDAQGLRRAAHSLKGNSVDFGALSLAALCRQLENEARENHLDGLVDLIAQIDAAYPLVELALRDILQKEAIHG
jgi:HPt (histidine-containing phosphotransfer) domain-containing protein